MHKRAFTLIELLVVIAIIAILAAVLFPVFAQAKISAKKTASISNQKQYMTANLMYMADYDDRTCLIQYNNSYLSSAGDKAVGQLVNAYMKSMDLLSDPNSPIQKQERLTRDLTNPATVPAQWQKEQTEFNLAIKADYGYNTQIFSPMMANCTPAAPNNFKAGSISHTQLGSPAETIMFINSMWDRAGNRVVGGGNWGIDLPCRRYTDGTDSLPPLEGCTARWWWGGWQPNSTAWNQFGGAWPYHAGKVVIGFADGHAKVMSISQTTVGCNVLPSWTGQIFDRNVYMWDME